LSTTASKAGYNSLVVEHIYLSPHLDDAVFSCGGLMARQTAAGESVIVVTVCAGDPPPGDLTPFAQELHARWKADRAPIEVRRSEDLAACERLCAGVIHFEIPDAVYRKASDNAALYPDEKSIFGVLHEFDTDLVDQLTWKLSRNIPVDAALYCPLGYDGHVDHRLTRQAAENLNRPLRYYPDLPYAARGGQIPDELGLPKGVEQRILLVSEEIKAWTQASSCYQSQISTFWTDEKALQAELCDYHDRENGLRLRILEG
jgi:LmbE family N-acetylglucosaminyl deacetylase